MQNSSEEKYDDIVKLSKIGVSNREICRRLGVGHSTIIRARRDAGLPDSWMWSNKIPKYKQIAIDAAIRVGFSNAAIARMVDVDRQTVRKRRMNMVPHDKLVLLENKRLKGS